MDSRNIEIWCESHKEIYCYGRRGHHSVSLSDLHRQTTSDWIMKILQLSNRTLFGGLLGLSLAFLLAEYCSQGLYEIYSTSTFFRTVTRNSPNSLAESLNQVSWALLFCGAWWMLWSFDHFFIPLEEKTESKFSENEDSASSTDAKEDETFKPEGENEQQGGQKESAFQEGQDAQEENARDDEPEIEEDFNDKDDHFFQVLKISEDSPRDFNSIKSTYRKKIAQYHPDKVSAMGPEIRDVAEQKAKEINEAYEHFRKKFSS